MNGPDALRILIVGASGLVGQGVLRACLSSAQTASGQRVVATSLVRRAGATPAAGVAEIVLADFADAGAHAAALAGMDACFYCAGAPPIGTAEAEYRHVTVALTLAVAQAYAAANPNGCFLYVSGAQANPRSRIMPLRIKGDIEQALAALPIRTRLLRPGGVRPVSGTGTSHRALKPLYAVARPLMRIGEMLLPGLLTSNEAIGRAMLALARRSDAPAVLDCSDINRWAR